jgi:hypothetical protein
MAAREERRLRRHDDRDTRPHVVLSDDGRLANANPRHVCDRVANSRLQVADPDVEVP